MSYNGDVAIKNIWGQKHNKKSRRSCSRLWVTDWPGAFIHTGLFSGPAHGHYADSNHLLCHRDPRHQAKHILLLKICTAIV